MDKKELIASITPLLKSIGYKKRGMTWVKNTDLNNSIYVVVNIQSSQYDQKLYYINLGIYIRNLGKKEVPTCINDCQMQERVNCDITSETMFINIIEKWEAWYGSFESIYQKLINDKMPMLTDKRIYTYFLINNQTCK